MDNFESQQFRDELAKTIKQAPKVERRGILDNAREGAGRKPTHNDHESSPQKPEYSRESLILEMEEERQEVIASTKKEITDLESRDPNDSYLVSLRKRLERYESYETDRMGYFSQVSNNFHARLPSGNMRFYTEEWAQKRVLDQKRTDERIKKERPPEYYKDLLEKGRKEVAEHSKLYNDIDKILISFGLDLEEVGNWLRKYFEEGRSKTEPEEYRKYWYDILPRLYIELRKLGYEHQPTLRA